jgi:hypothetical protein
LATRLAEIARQIDAGSRLTDATANLRGRLQALTWPGRAAELDDAIENVSATTRKRLQVGAPWSQAGGIKKRRSTEASTRRVDKPDGNR